MHRAAFAALGIDADYELRPTHPGQLDAAFAQMEAGRWRGVAGPEIAAHTAVQRFRNGTLTVLCDSSALLAELSSFYKADLLRKLQDTHSAAFVAKLQFKLAKLPEKP